MKTRIGKIARLPRTVRDELNLRLDNGEDGPALLTWLNGRPGTLKVMQDLFGGAPVTKQNLSDWRQGGWVDWQHQQEALALTDQLLEGAADLEARSKAGPLSDRMSVLVAVSLGHLLRDATRLPAGPEKTRAVLGAAHELNLLRQTDYDRERAEREAQDWERKQRDFEELDRKQAEQERKDELLAQFKADDRRELLTTLYGGGEYARRRAWFTVGVEFDLPESEWEPPEQDPEPTAEPTEEAVEAPTESNPVAPSRTQSYPVAPSSIETSLTTPNQSETDGAVHAEPGVPVKSLCCDPITQSNPVRPDPPCT